MKNSVLAGILFFALISCFPGYSAAQSEPSAEWLYDMEEAVKLSSEEDKPILISFSGSDWCLPCMRLERDLFSTEEFADFAATNLILVKADFPSRKKNTLSQEQIARNEALAEKYNMSGAFPLTLLTDAEGNVLGYMDHPLPSVKYYLDSITKIISRHP